MKRTCLGKGIRMVIRAILAGVVAASLFTVNASAAEVCRFSGTTDYDGQVAVTTDVTAADGATQVDVVLRFQATTMLWLHMHYLVQELSTWRGGQLQSAAVNIRYLIGEHIVRQQWDVFQRTALGLQGRRVQGKTLEDFRLKHPDFVQYWDPATFGRSWLHDYQFGLPERRADLDLKRSPLPPHLRTPLAMAFYWIRWMPHGGMDVPVFLPGFKAERLVTLAITGTPSAGGMLWRTPLNYASLSKALPSTATAWTSSDRYLMQLAFALHTSQGSASGLIHQEGCEGAPLGPVNEQRSATGDQADRR